jgi:magnesium-transporting ATPase (P-type)
MTLPPTAPDAPLLGRALLGRIAWLGAVITVVSLGFFTWEVSRGRPLAEARTAAFTLLAFCEWANVLNVRSETRSILSMPLWKNRWLLAGLGASVGLQAAVLYWPPLMRLFRTVHLPAGEIGRLALLGCIVVLAEEVRKAILRRRRRAAGAT